MNIYAGSVQVVIDPRKTSVMLVPSDPPDIYWIRFVGVGDQGSAALSIAINGGSREQAECLVNAFNNALLPPSQLE
jgi:hypothetical protein